MINLLPIQDKKALHRDYMIRVIVVVCIAIACIGVISSIFLLPSYLAVHSKYREYKSSEEQYTRLFGDSRGSFISIVENTNRQLLVFPQKPNAYVPTRDVLFPLLDDRTQGIFVTEVFYIKEDDSTIVLEIQGTASSRENLLRFTKALEGSGRYGDVSVPLSNFAKDKNIGFSIRVVQKI